MHFRHQAGPAVRLAVTLATASLVSNAAVAHGQFPVSDSAASAIAPGLPAGPRITLLRVGISVVDSPTVIASPKQQQRPRAVEHSEWFYRRQDLHRYASYLTLPLFIAQYLAGEELLKNGDSSNGWAKDIHPVLAGGIWGLFAVNTVTGAWNWWDTRGEPEGRVKRTLHAALMLAADVGFATIGEAENEGGSGGEDDGTSEHRRHAIVSMSIATAGYLMMILPFWKD